MRNNLNNNFSVLDKIISLTEETPGDPLYTVPQNSLTNFNHKLGLCELETSTKNHKSSQICKCPHCENMAKNFLYLESLIRTNATNTCNVCHSSLEYLQNVNKSILKVFGSIDTITPPSPGNGHNIKTKSKLQQQKRQNKKSTITHNSSPKLLVTNKKKQIKVINSSLKGERRMKGGQSLTKNSIGKLRKSNKKSKLKEDSNNQSVVNAASMSKNSKALEVKKIKVFKSKTKKLFKKLKTKK
ncbi:uncharacterized protein ACRADG_003572 [Cochliomyia hominivorax]